jgi:hypothetical protein
VTKCYLFDIDGTLADLTHRLPHIQKQPKDWPAFFDACEDDQPIEHVCELARQLSNFEKIVLVSGRSDRCRDATENWLRSNHIHWNALYMRRNGDHRPDDLVKGELLDLIVQDGWEPIMAFDDRDRVVAMWRERGIPCAQVAAGDNSEIKSISAEFKQSNAVCDESERCQRLRPLNRRWGNQRWTA